MIFKMIEKWALKRVSKRVYKKMEFYVRERKKVVKNIETMNFKVYPNKEAILASWKMEKERLDEKIVELNNFADMLQGV